MRGHMGELIWRNCGAALYIQLSLQILAQNHTYKLQIQYLSCRDPCHQKQQQSLEAIVRSLGTFIFCSTELYRQKHFL